KKVQNEKMEVEQYKNCPFVVKLSCAYKKYWPKNKLINITLNWIIKLMSSFFAKTQFNKKYLLIFSNLVLTKSTMDNDFFLYVNIATKFMLKDDKDAQERYYKKLFGFDVICPPFSADKTIFLKNGFLVEMTLDHHDDPVITINAPLKPEVREAIAEY